MYRGWRDAWTGFSKNATEGMATPAALPVWTVLLGGGHLLPWLLLPLAPFAPPATALTLLGAAAAGPLLRLALALRFGQPAGPALLHPLGIAALLAIQWSALARAWRGQPSTWRGRAYPTGGA
ncbi:MAG TPA: hypothetical protein VMM55_12180 [Thermohalobaculum sp.]|nr:hypothetical protein [Thermohalobaculum sp.]